MLLPPNFELLSLKDIGCLEEIPETALTLEGNARIKAEYIYQNYNYPCFADDTGLLVEALNGEPGVHSARFAGAHKNADDNIDKLLATLEGNANRSASFVTVIALKTTDDIRLFRGEVHGQITGERLGNAGFGYDPVFRPEGFRATFAELSTSEKNAISHRGQAFEQLLAYLNQWEG